MRYVVSIQESPTANRETHYYTGKTKCNFKSSPSLIHYNEVERIIFLKVIVNL